MLTNKEDFTKKRKTRLESLEERILTAEKLIEELNKELKDEELNEIAKLVKTLNELREMKQKIIDSEKNDRENIDEEVKRLTSEGLLLINMDKVRIMNENEAMKKNKIQREDYIKKLEEQIMMKNLAIELAKQKENELIEHNSILEDKVKSLKSKAYGYDIAKKFEIHQNKINNDKKLNNQIDPNRHKAVEDDNLAYNLWERENNNHLRNPSKLEDLTKQKQLWIGNSASNIEKLMFDINAKSMKNNNSNIITSINSGDTKNIDSNLNSNMRKYSPMILNNK